MLYDDGKNVRLLYELEVPMYPQEAQEQLGILKTGDLTIQVRVSPMLSSHLNAGNVHYTQPAMCSEWQ